MMDPPEARPPSAPPKGGSYSVSDYNSSEKPDKGQPGATGGWPGASWPQKGWSEMEPPPGDDRVAWFAQQYACIRQGGAMDGDGFCTYNPSDLGCTEAQASDALTKSCISLADFSEMVNDFAECRAAGGVVDPETMSCEPKKKSKAGIWIGLGVAAVAVGLFVATQQITPKEERA